MALATRSVEVERTFSIFFDIKTQRRTRLSSKKIDAYLRYFLDLHLFLFFTLDKTAKNNCYHHIKTVVILFVL